MNRSPSRFLDPWRDRLDRVRERVGADVRRTWRAARAARGCAGSGRSAALRRAARAPALRLRVIQAAPAHSPSITRGCQSPSGQRGDEKQRIEAAHGVELRHPARERRQRRRHRAQVRARRAGRRKACRRPARPAASRVMPASGTGDSPTGTAVSSIVSRIAATAAGVDAELARRAPVGLVDPPAGEDQAPAAKAMPPARSTISSSGGPARAFADQDQRRGGDCSSLTGRRRLHAADVLLVASLRVDGIVDDGILLAAAAVLRCCLSAAAWRWRASIAAWLASSLSCRPRAG